MKSKHWFLIVKNRTDYREHLANSRWPTFRMQQLRSIQINFECDKCERLNGFLFSECRFEKSNAYAFISTNDQLLLFFFNLAHYMTTTLLFVFVYWYFDLSSLAIYRCFLAYYVKSQAENSISVWKKSLVVLKLWKRIESVLIKIVMTKKCGAILATIFLRFRLKSI